MAAPQRAYTLGLLVDFWFYYLPKKADTESTSPARYCHDVLVFPVEQLRWVDKICRDTAKK